MAKKLQVIVLLLDVLVVCASADFGLRRRGRQVQGASVDFSNAVLDPESGKQCVLKEDEVESLQKEPILECQHKRVEKCHYTYVTQFSPAQEEVCEENFEKKCQITFQQQAIKETVKKCNRPLIKVCNGQGKDICKTVYESSCSTRYLEKNPGKFVGDTRCERVPVEICGAGCVAEEGPEECHDKTLTSLIDVPEEVCDLNPQKTCRLQTKLVPSLMPKRECTIVPQEICSLKFTPAKLVKKPLVTKWCLDDSSISPGQTFSENDPDQLLRNEIGFFSPQLTPSDFQGSASILQPRIAGQENQKSRAKIRKSLA